MAANSPEKCVRCQRPAPPVESDDYLEWEAAGDEGNIICPGCLTGEEVDRMIDEDALTADEAREQADREGCGE
jgi:hypothetical protein